MPHLKGHFRVKQRRYIAAFALIVVLAAGAHHLISSRPPAVDVSQETIVVSDDERSFRLVVPKAHSDSVSVVFAFHGMGDSPDSMAAHSRLDYLAAENGFILVYPAGRKSMWLAHVGDSGTLDANRDVQFFDAVLEDISSRYDIDGDRVYVMGMSNGASFVQLLATARSDVVAAAVAHSGSRPQELPDSERAFPILLIVGSDDPVATSMQSDFDDYRSVGHDVDLVTVDGLGHAWSTGHNSDAWDFLANHWVSQ